MYTTVALIITNIMVKDSLYKSGIGTSNRLQRKSGNEFGPYVVWADLHEGVRPKQTHLVMRCVRAGRKGGAALFPRSLSPAPQELPHHPCFSPHPAPSKTAAHALKESSDLPWLLIAAQKPLISHTGTSYLHPAHGSFHEEEPLSGQCSFESFQLARIYPHPS